MQLSPIPEVNEDMAAIDAGAEIVFQNRRKTVSFSNTSQIVHGNDSVELVNDHFPTDGKRLPQHEVYPNRNPSLGANRPPPAFTRPTTSVRREPSVHSLHRSAGDWDISQRNEDNESATEEAKHRLTLRQHFDRILGSCLAWFVYPPQDDEDNEVYARRVGDASRNGCDFGKLGDGTVVARI